MTCKLALAALFSTTAALLTASSAHAHFSLGDPNPGGITYRGVVGVHNNTSTLTDSTHVGAWSWDDGSGGANTGWTHTSAWYAINLEVPGYFTFTISPKADVPWPSTALPNRLADTAGMYPSFTLWGGWDDVSTATHVYQNNGPITWSPVLTYIDSQSNTTQQSVTYSRWLEAGEYTLVIGSNDPAATSNPNRQGYQVAFSNPTAVPEPTSALLALTGAVGLLARRRKA
jgi:hypothetical protein